MRKLLKPKNDRLTSSIFGQKRGAPICIATALSWTGVARKERQNPETDAKGRNLPILAPSK